MVEVFINWNKGAKTFSEQIRALGTQEKGGANINEPENNIWKNHY